MQLLVSPPVAWIAATALRLDEELPNSGRKTSPFDRNKQAFNCPLVVETTVGPG